MVIGNLEKDSPIIAAIQEAEAESTIEIQVHLSKRWLEINPLKRAKKLFIQYEMSTAPERPLVLLYVNLRKKLFSVATDIQTYNTTSQVFWEIFLKEFGIHLRSTQSEKAIALGVKSLGEGMKKFFPSSLKYDLTERVNM